MSEAHVNVDGTICTVSPSTGANKVAAQLSKLREANVKYKSLLKMAKDRIEQQEEELKKWRADWDKQRESANDGPVGTLEDQMEIEDRTELSWNIVRILQRVKVDCGLDQSYSNGENEEIWALVELELVDLDLVDPIARTPKRTKKWKRFDSEAELADYIRRDIGEPLTLPPYSLTPQQSLKVQNEAQQVVTNVNEDYRRFRVKSEMARKKAEAQVKELQSTTFDTAKRRIESHHFLSSDKEMERLETSRLERTRSEMARQDAQWREAYDLLLAENNALKSSGSEALLASQWRQRYETCLQEKEKAENQLKLEREKEAAVDIGKYEMKYRDLKESFRLYRKKAREIFEAQQAGQTSAQIMLMSEKSNEDSKLSYLKNLMVNYLTSDLAVREHMEGAIGTVLQFTPNDIEKN